MQLDNLVVIHETMPFDDQCPLSLSQYYKTPAWGT